MSRIHPTLIDTPFKVGFECAITDARRAYALATVVGIDQPRGIVTVSQFGKRTQHFKWRKSCRRWASCEQDYKGWWIFCRPNDHYLVW